MNSFFQFLDQFHHLSEKSKYGLESSVKTVKLPKGSLLAKEGKVCSEIHFIVHGAVRGYHMLEGKDMTYWFGFENTFITSQYSFISRKPALESIITIENSTAIVISYDELQKLYSNYPELERLGRILAEHYYIIFEERMFSYMFKTAKERYEMLLSSSPHILQRVPLGYIASYLGITQETLSRIRSKL